jgi:hypothetical protein
LNTIDQTIRQRDTEKAYLEKMKSKKELIGVGLLLMTSSIFLITIASDFLPLLVIGILNGIAGILLTIAKLRKPKMK